jgi:hypothetical protein
VTGEEGLLQLLAKRGDKPADLSSLEPLLTAAPSDYDFFVALDLRAARRAGWPLPTEWLDVWPLGRDAWRAIWNLPSALSFSFDRGDFALAELGFLCDGQTVAEKVHLALEQWIPQAKSVLTARIEALPASIQSGEIPTRSADRYQLAMSGSLAALESAHMEVVDRCLWLRADFGSNSPAWTSAASESRVAMRSDWYRAAGHLDESTHRQLQRALTDYAKTADEAPAGAINSDMLAPEKVLSWMTAMLPYLGHESWAEDLDVSYSWNHSKNRPVTSRTLEAVQNPAVSVRETDSGFPVTHYAGVAGIGPEAADLPRDDPRAGIFGYRESRRLTNVPDGASNTIATAGVAAGLGPWAAGGKATVRGFTQQPYINGPDGFGSGQPNGMYVGMADGSARFLAANIAPEVLEQLATAGDGKPARAATPPADEVVSVEPKLGEPPKIQSPVAETPDARQPEPPDVPPEEQVIDPAERLRAPVPGVAMTNVPLHQAIRSIESYGSLLVTFDLDTMAALGVRLDRPVSVQLTGATVGRALETVLASCGLKAVVRNNQMWITGAGQAQDMPRQVRYTVTDLTSPDGMTPADLASWITQLIAPETWRDSGGKGTVRVVEGALEITQSETVHLEVLKFCEKLRVARNLSPRSRRPAEQFRLTTRRVQAVPVLQEPVTVNIFRPTALRRIARELDSLSEARIAVNWMALADEGKSPSLPGTITATQVPLEQVLDQVLGPLGLDHRVIDDRTIEITTRAAADARFEREFYPIDDLLDAGHTLPSLVDRVRSATGAEKWESGGGKGIVLFDEPSRSVIVLQTQRAQATVERSLDSLRKTPEAASGG